MSSDKAIEVLNRYLGEEARKLSTGQVLKTVLSEVSDGYEDLCEIGKNLQEAIKPYDYLLEEGKEDEYLRCVGPILFGPNSKISERGTE